MKRQTSENSFDTAGKVKASPTHSLIQQVNRHRGITPSTKLVLIYLLGKYQTKREDGRPWDFSHASIEHGTGLPRRTVYNIMKVLITAKVLKHYGQVKVRTHPMNLYLFVPEALNTYLKDSAKSEMTIIDNASAVETTIEATPKDRDSAKDSAKDSATIAHHKKSTQEDLQKKKEGTSTSTGKIIESSTGQPSMAVAPSSTQEDLAELFESQFNGCPALQSKVPSDCQFAACGGWQVPPSVQSAPEGKENISTGSDPSRGLMTCPVPLYGK